jgi:parallel beta-helix repeat protein
MNFESDLSIQSSAFLSRGKSACTFLLALLWLVMFLAIFQAQSAQGATYYIATNGNDSWTGTAPAFVSGNIGPWLTFKHIDYGASPGLQPGDVVYVRGGIYDHTGDNLSTSIYLAGISGTQANPIVISNYPGETPIIFGSGPNCGTISLTGVSWVNILGINSTNAYRQVYLQKITNCEFAYCDVGGGNTNIGYLQPFFMYNCSQSNWIHNNTIHDALAYPYADSTHGMTIGQFFSTNDWTSFNIIESNTCYHAGHDAFSCYGPSNIIVGNFIHNENWFFRVDLEHEGSHRCIEVGGYLGYANVIEGNRAQYAGYNKNTPHGLELDGPGTCIIRNNVFSDNEYSGIAIYGCKMYQNALYWGSNYVYNNTIAKNGFGPSSIPLYTNGIPYQTNNVTPWLPAVTIANSTNNVFVNNLLWGNYNNIIIGENLAMNVGAAVALNNVSTTSAAMFVDTNDAGPWSQTQPNYALQPGSPGIDAGTWLTSVTSPSGSGTSFTVADPHYFFAGLTAASRTIPGDIIQLQGQANPATVTAISGNTITVATPLTWTQGQGLALAYSGSAPDVGAFEYYALAPPSDLRIVATPSH